MQSNLSNYMNKLRAFLMMPVHLMPIFQSPTHELLSNRTTQIVVFGFDGTLTSGTTTNIMWETLWTDLGYDIRSWLGYCLNMTERNMCYAEYICYKWRG